MPNCRRCALEMPEMDEAQKKQAKEEWAQNFPGDPWIEDEIDVLCDDCYASFMVWFMVWFKRQVKGG